MTSRRGFLVSSVSSAILGVLLVGCATGNSEGIARTTPKGTRLYTQFGFFHEDWEHDTTNYRKGLFVRMNTEVDYIKSSGNKLFVILPDGHRLTIENDESRTGVGIDGIFRRMFSEESVDLSQFSELERRAIRTGDVRLGMRKQAVLCALGYPPAHKTPSLESSQWRYWHDRFDTFLVIFDDSDRVVEIKE